MSNYKAYLKPVHSSSGNHKNYQLSTTNSTVIGREPSCQITLDSTCKGVSRRHAEIRPLMTRAPDGSPQWQICDLGSANGTFINKQPVPGCQTLRPGDHIYLGKKGAEFIFECQLVPSRPPVRPINLPLGNSLHLSQVVPIVATKQDLLQKGFLIPGIVTVLFVVGLFATLGNPVLFNALLAIYLSLGGYYFIYRLSGKSKPWWLLVASASITIFIIITPFSLPFFLVFRQILPGDPSNVSGFIPTFIAMFFGAGLMEELLKAVPVFIALWMGLSLNSPWREKIGVWEPLDGILLGAASAVGFTLVETLGQYVPENIAAIVTQYGEGMGQLVGLQLLIPRIIGSVAGHMAYSGYFGYFIGLSMLKPSKRWLILGIGYLTSSLLHALWNASGGFLLPIVGILAYVFLVAAILKARQLSPNRQQNFATQYRPPKNS